MAVNIATGAEVKVAGGPTIKTARTLPVDAYDLIDVDVPAGAEEFVVEVQPAADTTQVRFLLISASQYDPALTYRVNDEANPSHELDQALILTGAGAIGLLGFVPESLLFTNDTDSDITVQILVGRNVSPTP